MPNKLTPLEICKVDLFASEEELRDRYPLALCERVLRLREMYNYWLANPSMKDRQLRDAIMSRYGVSQSTAYSDIGIIHQLVPLLADKSPEFHRARANEMLLETYAMAKARKDTKVMAQVAATYAKANALDKETDQQISFEDVPTQPFAPTLDPRILGLEPIPDVFNYIDRLVKDLSGDHADIIDVTYEEPDLEEKHLFAPTTDNGTGKS